jgi:hypothetical protein
MLVPTGAVPFAALGTDRPSGMANVELSPADGPHGDYAVLNEDGEIELLLSEENPYIDHEGVLGGSETSIPRVFNITYTGTDSVRVWLTDDTDAIRFFHGADHTDSIEGEGNRVTLDADETVSVGLWIDSSDAEDVERVDSFEVHARLPDSGGSGDDDNDDDDGDDRRSTTETTTVTTVTFEAENSDDGDTDGDDGDDVNRPPDTPESTTTTTPPPTETTTSDVDDGEETTTTAGDSGDLAASSLGGTGGSGTTTTTESDGGTSSSSAAGVIPAELGGGSLVGTLGVAVGTGLLVLGLVGSRRFRGEGGG